MQNRADSLLEVFLNRGDAQLAFFPLLSIQDIALLAQTNKNLNTAFKPDVEAHTPPVLAQYILEKNIKKTINFINLHPESLFTIIEEVKDANGHTYKNVSPFLLAWDSENLNLCKALMPIINHLPYGKTTALQQLKQWFSNPTSYDFTSLTTALRLENYADLNNLQDSTTDAIEKFNEDIKFPTINNANHLNCKFVLEALQVFDSQFKKQAHEFVFIKEILGSLWSKLPEQAAQKFPAKSVFHANEHGIFGMYKNQKKSLKDNFKTFHKKNQKGFQKLEKELSKPTKTNKK